MWYNTISEAGAFNDLLMLCGGVILLLVIRVGFDWHRIKHLNQHIDAIEYILEKDGYDLDALHGDKENN